MREKRGIELPVGLHLREATALKLHDRVQSGLLTWLSDPVLVGMTREYANETRAWRMCS